LRASFFRKTQEDAGVPLVSPHEVHLYEQIKYINEPDWECRLQYGCVICKNPNPVGGPALLCEVKSQYKRANWAIPDTQSTREHCIMGQQEIWACLESNLVIEPDTSFLPNGDRPMMPGNVTTCPDDPRA
jgi:hypothetical protein